MRNKLGVLSVLVGMLLIVSMSTFAQAVATNTVAPVASPDQMPGWLTMVLGILSSLPVVGPALLFVLKWMGVLCVALTCLSALLKGLSSSLKGVAKLAGFLSVVDKIQSIEDKVLPWVKYLSMFNVQKAELSPKDSGSAPLAK